MPTCDSCGRECPAEALQEFKMFGERSYICKECIKQQRLQRGN